MKLRERITIEADVPPARLVNELAKRGVTAESVRKAGARTRFTVDKRLSRKTFAFLEEMCYNYSVISTVGLLPWLKRNAFRSGLLIGFLVFFGLYAFLFGFIWKVEITGTESLSVKTVAERAASLGAGIGARTKGIDLAALETALRQTEGILECSAEIRGVTLKISVMENTEFNPPEHGARTDITSGYDAEVTRVICEKGTPRVKAGDRIPAGAVLIEGASYSTMGDDYGNPILLEEYPARGTVYGKTVLAKSVALPETSYRLVRTGAVKRRTQLSLWGMRIGKTDSPYSLYECETRVGRLAPVPVSVLSFRYYECAAEEVAADVDRAVAGITEELKTAAELKGGICGETTHTVKSEGGIYYISVYVESEIIIGEL